MTSTDSASTGSKEIDGLIHKLEMAVAIASLDVEMNPDSAYDWGACDIRRDLCLAIARIVQQRDALRITGQAVVDRWDTPAWKDAPPTANFISALRASLARASE
jgi:hypothetical protein